MTNVESPVIQHSRTCCQIKKRLKYEQAASGTDVIKKCKLQVVFNCSADMVLHLFWSSRSIAYV